MADLGTGTLAGARGRSLAIDLIANKAALVAVGDGSFTYTLASPLPAGVNGDVMATLYGRRQFADTSRAYPQSAVFFPGAKRQELVSQAKCENCHEFVFAHGGSRAGNPMMCNACHNSSGGWAAEGFGPIAFGAFAHNLHAGKIEEIGENHLSAEPQPVRGVPPRRHVLRRAHGRAAHQHRRGSGSGSRRQRHPEPEPVRRHLGFRDGRHLRHLPRLRTGQGPHGAERRCVRCGRWQDADSIVNDRSLRRLPWPGPRGGHSHGTRRVMTMGRVPRWAPGLRPDEDGSSSHDIAQ